MADKPEPKKGIEPIRYAGRIPAPLLPQPPPVKAPAPVAPPTPPPAQPRVEPKAPEPRPTFHPPLSKKPLPAKKK